MIDQKRAVTLGVDESKIGLNNLQLIKPLSWCLLQAIQGLNKSVYRAVSELGKILEPWLE